METRPDPTSLSPHNGLGINVWGHTLQRMAVGSLAIEIDLSGLVAAKPR